MLFNAKCYTLNLTLFKPCPLGNHAITFWLMKPCGESAVDCAIEERKHGVMENRRFTSWLQLNIVLLILLTPLL